MSGNSQILTSVRNAARLLSAFSADERELGVSELARKLDLGKSTTFRLLATLGSEGLVEKNPESGKYRLGLRIYELGALVSAHLDIHEAAAGVLDRLRDASGETTHLAILDGREVVYVERAESGHTVRIFGRVGHRNWAHCTSTGKVLLAYLPVDELDRLLDGWELPRLTEVTITDESELRKELQSVRRRGWAENLNETEIGVASIAAPIRDTRGRAVAAVSVAAPVMRLEGGTPEGLAPLVQQAARTISRRMGHRTSAGRAS